MDNFNLSRTLVENINNQNDKINNCIDIVNGLTKDEEIKVIQELRINEELRQQNELVRQQNELARQEQYNNNESKFTEINQQVASINEELDKIVKYDVVVGLGCDNTGVVEIGDIIQAFLDDTNNEKINLYFPPGTYKWNITVTTNKTLFINGERGNVIINNSGNLACLKHNGNCTINGLTFSTSSSNRTEFTVYSNNGGEFLCYDTIFTCTSGKINGLHIENTTISHIDRCKFNQSQISLKTWDCKITNTWVWALWRPYGIGIHGGCGNINLSNVDVVPPFKTNSGNMDSTEFIEGIKGGIWVNSEGGNVTNNIIMENIYLDGNPSLYTGIGVLCENAFGITISSFRANKMSDYPIVIDGCYNVIISKGTFLEDNKLDVTGINEILIKNPNSRKCDNINITDNQFINYKTGITNKSPAIKVNDDVTKPVTIKYNKICQQTGNDCAYGDVEIKTPSMTDLSTNTGSRYAYKLTGSITVPKDKTGISLTLPNFMVTEPTQKNFRFWVDNGYLPVLRVQKNAKNNVWLGFQSAITSEITIHYEVNI